MLLYRLFVSLAAPLLLGRLLLRRLRGRESARSLAERLGGGLPPGPPAKGPLLWLHGASNGELASARALVETALARMPGLRILVTANTETGRDLAESWGLPGVAAALAPLDHRLALARFLRRRRPGALVVVENEFWPNRLALARSRGLPVLAVGARMSARSARRWARMPGLTRQILDAMVWLSAQDEGSEERFRTLGLVPARIGPRLTLKAAAAPEPPAAELARLAPRFPRPLTLLAASTHPGEEETVLAAFAAARHGRPGLRLILAPRHAARGPEIAVLLARMGLAFATRSKGEEPAADTPVWLADTMGEMALWYALAGICFVGGSLVAKGGHTPFEPAALGSAILTGPDTANAGPAYRALFAAGAALEVQDAPSLARAIGALADDPARQRRQAEAARRALAGIDDAEARGSFFAALAHATGWQSLAE